MSQYGLCSSNSACGCLPLVFAANVGVCGLTGISCSRLSSCLPDDTCPTADHVCVYHPRCGSTPLCYPLSMVDQRLCPPMATTVTTAMPLFTTQTMTRSTFATEETTEIMETTDYDPHGFTTDSFSPSCSITSNYSNALTSRDLQIPNTSKYYQAIEILVNTSGYYEIRSLSTMDTYGCLFHGNYNPSDSSNQIMCNDDHIDTQFKLTPYLEAGVSYSLLVTTFAPGITGSYKIIACGPDEMQFNWVETPQRTMTTTPIYFTTATTAYPYDFTSNYPDEFTSNYSDALTLNSGTFSRGGASGSNFYYEAIQINVMTAGAYTFISRSNMSDRIMDTTGTYSFTDQTVTDESIMDTTYTYPFTDDTSRNLGDMDAYGYIYRDTFFPTNPSANMIQQDDDNGGNRQFRLTVTLQPERTYVLVFTTFTDGVIGPFSILASGPGDVSFRPIKHT